MRGEFGHCAGPCPLPRPGTLSKAVEINSVTSRRSCRRLVQDYFFVELFAFLIPAQRFLCAAAIRARPSGEIVRRLRLGLAAGFRPLRRTQRRPVGDADALLDTSGNARLMEA